MALIFERACACPPRPWSAPATCSTTWLSTRPNDSACRSWHGWSPCHGRRAPPSCSACSSRVRPSRRIVAVRARSGLLRDRRRGTGGDPGDPGRRTRSRGSGAATVVLHGCRHPGSGRDQGRRRVRQRASHRFPRELVSRFNWLRRSAPPSSPGATQTTSKRGSSRPTLRSLRASSTSMSTRSTRYATAATASP